jgi:pimeloyl-ACP methyl ester carboxylesterase
LRIEFCDGAFRDRQGDRVKVPRPSIGSSLVDRREMDTAMHRTVWTLALVASLFAGGCAPSIGVRPLDSRQANLALTANVLTSGSPSESARELLYRADLAARFEKDPAATIAALRSGLGGRDEQDRLYTLAELSYAHGMRSGDAAHHLAAAVYAWDFLFPDEEGKRPGRYDPRIRAAMDIYNRALAEGLTVPGTRTIDLRERAVGLPFGVLDITVAEGALRYAGQEMKDLTSLAGLETRGLRNRYRHRGIGAPVAASMDRTDPTSAARWLGPYTKVPLTMLLRLDQAGAASERLSGVVELHRVEESAETVIAGETIPLESDRTAALAYQLADSPVWDIEIAGFRRGDLLLGSPRPGGQLFMLHPCQPDRIPIVFVHGTASSPARWAEMVNEFQNDPELGRRYQFWFFVYNTGNPVAYSAMQLRDALQDVMRTVDPVGAHPALQRMVVIGHSQGGLLTKMTAVRSGSRFWDAISSVPFQKAELAPETRELLAKGLFVEPLPFVRRLVFIATPHRGSILAGGFVTKMIRRLVHLPGRVAGLGADIVRLQAAGALRRIAYVPTSVDNMSAGNPFLESLRELPIVDGVRAHSIIAVKGDGPPEEGNDGVVAYQSAYLEGLDSTLVVRSPHSTQGTPATIEEVRRILYLELESP